MDWALWLFNLAVLSLLGFWFYKMRMSWLGKGVLLAPILIYVLFAVEDLLNWIDLGDVVPGNGGMRALILLFCLASVLFYILFIFHEIKESNSREVRLQSTLLRISVAALSCIIFFTVVYTSIYKLFGQTSFEGKGLGQDLLSQLISFLYFSVATFTTVGYGDIAAVDNTSRLAVIMQISFSFITVAYALSMLGLFRKILGPGGEEEVESAVDVDLDEAMDSGGTEEEPNDPKKDPGGPKKEGARDESAQDEDTRDEGTRDEGTRD
ncbi:potassium channel family protein [Paenibacillus sp. CN-4]|uniref:potassium channel family protein n=1 Tax=Paenibacillus nanchangensis TaxID=3348343 RepID=UPI003979CE0A